ncbi:MAG: histone chaperone Rttp106-like-domain-containing protein, partial [Olpidium bornovanus]
MPYRELGFDGVPFRSNVFLQPTDHCLVHLTDPPFLVVPIEDIEIAHLERVQFGLKNFDLVIVFKDFTRPPVHINTIPMGQLENVKAWLDRSLCNVACLPVGSTQDVAFSEGQVNLNWGAIMKTINDDPAAFFEDGGWSFVQGDADDEESDESESASEYELSDDYEDESSDDESSFNEGSSSGSGSEAEEDESGEDWDELERKAKKADSKAASGGVGGPSAKRKTVEKASASTTKKARR